MKPRQTHLIILEVIVMVLFSATLVFAFPPGGGRGDCNSPGSRMERRRELIREKLNLSPDQEAALDAQRTRHRTEAKQYRESIRTTRKEMKQELQKEKLDMERIQQLQASLKDLHAKMADLRLQGILEVRKILTPDQFSQFMKMTEKWRHGKGMRRGPRAIPPDVPKK
jgi:Spy/CpxP family protein refolding chaperone